jgi:hypothetical protein
MGNAKERVSVRIGEEQYIVFVFPLEHNMLIFLMAAIHASLARDCIFLSTVVV